ncbi:MAG TPA: DUF2125 domain-containing protein [Stellaceae bacterium]|nr:DUF2125 domain-containing protein [Stellaceae bacterium]
MKFSVRYLAIFVGAIVILAVASYTAYWFVTAGRLRAGLEKWAADHRAQGYDIAWARASVGGFPLMFRIGLDDASLARGNTYRIAAPEITGEATPWDLSRWRISVPRGANGNAQGVDATITARSLRGEVVLGAADSRFDLSALHLAGAGAEAGTVTAQIVLPRRAPQSHRDLGLAAAVQVYHLMLPRPVKALGNTVESFALEFHIMGGLPPGDWRQALTAWRDEGGTIEVTRGALQWGALDLETSGTLALDRYMQPTAAMTASVVDQDALIDAAVAAGLLPKQNMTVVKLVLDLIARPGADGRTRLTAPVTMEDGKLSIGQAEIGKVPPVEWK